MLFIIEFLIYLSYFIYKLYIFIDSEYIYSNNGSKLKKYLLQSDLLSKENLLNNKDLNGKNNKFSIIKNNKTILKNFFSIKQIIYFLLIFISILIFKFSISYEFFQTNFLYINILNKNIDIISFLSNNSIIFKLLYYFLFSFFVINIMFKISIYILKENSKKESLKLKDIDESCKLNINIGVNENLEDVNILENGLFQNILITGSIGSGKTSTAITNILNGLIKNNVFGIVIDVKGSYINILKELIKRSGRAVDLTEISIDSKFKYNPIDKPNLSSIELANRIKKVLVLLSNENNSDSFWLDKSEVYIQYFITIIRAYKKYVDFYELHTLVIDSNYLDKKINIIKNKIVNNEYSDSELFNINSAIINIKNEYLKLDDRTLNIIKAEITRVTNVFVSDDKIYNQFCQKSSDFNINEDKIIVLCISIGENEKLAKIISTYLKLDFQKQVLSNNKEDKKTTFFVCDEYQVFANSEDAEFFSLSREYKCINVVSMQSYTSLVNSMKNRHSAYVIIQNLVNKIWFRNDDLETVNQIIKQVGKSMVENKSLNFSETGQNTKYNFLSKGFKEYKSGLSQSYSLSEKLEYIVDEKYIMQDLKTFEAICMLSDGNSINFEKKIKMKRWDENE